MSPRKGRHPRRKGPGGPRRTSRVGRDAEVIPITRAVDARHRAGLLGPSIDNLVASLLSALRTLVPDDPGARPIGVEVWADRMAATVYGPDQMPPDFYADLAEGLLGSADPDARPALAALALVLGHDDAADLRDAHADHRDRLSSDDPSDLGIGRAVARRAFEIDHVQGDGVTLMVEVDQPGAPHCVGVYIDHTLGGLAKDLLVGPPWTQVEATYRAGPGITVREVPLAEVRARYEAAMDLTDHTLDPPVPDDFEDTRPLVARRMALLPPDGEVPEVPIPDGEEVEELVEAFLDSPEAAALDPAVEEQAGWLIDLWITHATGYAVGSPHRLSPMLVEVFCVDWYPRKALVDAETVAAAPAVLAAWAHYAARITRLDDEWRDEALAAIAAFTPAMAAALPTEGIGADELDGLDPEIREAFLSGVADDGVSIDDLEAGLADGSRTTRPSVSSPDERSWTPLAPAPVEPRRLHWEADAHGVVPEVATKVKAICLGSSALAADLLGEVFVQPAVDLAVRIGEVDPSPLPHTQDRAWTAAIVWLLAEDSGAFVARTPGRRRDDLAADLPLGRTATTRRAGQIRDLLGLAPGDVAVDW